MIGAVLVTAVIVSLVTGKYLMIWLPVMGAVVIALGAAKLLNRR